MCLIHDFGEAITGDIPAFLKTVNEADISTWLPREYEENLTYGQKNCEWSEWTKELRTEIKEESIRKISKSRNIK